MGTEAGGSSRRGGVQAVCCFRHCQSADRLQVGQGASLCGNDKSSVTLGQVKTTEASRDVERRHRRRRMLILMRSAVRSHSSYVFFRSSGVVVSRSVSRSMSSQGPGPSSGYPEEPMKPYPPPVQGYATVVQPPQGYAPAPGYAPQMMIGAGYQPPPSTARRVRCACWGRVHVDPASTGSR